MPFSFQGLEEMDNSSSQYLPFCQLIISKGIFIKKDCADQVEFTPKKGWVEHTESFASGATPGYLCAKPKMLVLRKGDLSMFSKTTGKYIGKFDKEYDEANKVNIIKKCRYLVYFLGEDNKPLHSKPLAMTTKGKFGYSFGEAHKEFTQECAKAVNDIMGTNFSQYSEVVRYFVFDIVFKHGKDKDYPTTSITEVKSFVSPLGDSEEEQVALLEKLYLGNDKELVTKLKSDYEEFDISFSKDTQASNDTLAVEAPKPKVTSDALADMKKKFLSLATPDEVSASDQTVDVDVIPF